MKRYLVKVRIFDDENTYSKQVEVTASSRYAAKKRATWELSRQGYDVNNVEKIEERKENE